MQFLNHFRHGHEWFFAVFLVSAIILLANLVHDVAFFIIRRHRKDAGVERPHTPLSINKYLNHPARWVFLAICVLSVIPWVPIPNEFRHPIRVWLHVVLVILVGWFAVGCVYVLQDMLMRRYDLTAAKTSDPEANADGFPASLKP